LSENLGEKKGEKTGPIPWENDDPRKLGIG
jgi:hypothetical protein